ncbi:MAG: LysE family translocator [Alphaproteobacteria bacterium]|nr:LysE family translocator [Alphaproteobacteria bacterium]
MPLEHWIAFVAASVVLLAIPGPTVLLVVSYALGHGRRSAAATVAGVALGDFTAMTGSLLGLGAVLAASATLFLALKWVGAAYLIYLGVKLWRAPVGAGSGLVAAPAARPGRIFLHAYAVTALNPKSLVFFVAFLPQFVDHHGDVPVQLAVFGATFLVLATANALAYAMLAAAARRVIRRPGVQRAVNRTGGGFLVGAGLLTALWRRQPA